MGTEDATWDGAGGGDRTTTGANLRRAAPWRRVAAIVLAIGAIEPLALSRHLSNGSGGGESGSLSYGYQTAVHRPVTVLVLAAAALWIAAAGLWAAPARRVIAAAGFAAIAAVAACVVALATTAPARTAAVSRMELARLQRGESEAVVVARLGPAPDEGSTEPSDPSRSIPCLVYNAVDQPPGGGSSSTGAALLCFRGGRLVLKAPIP